MAIQMRIRSAVTSLMATLALIGYAAGFAHGSTLELRVVDELTKALVPARVELLSAAGDSLIADDALPIISECLLAPMPGWLKQKPPTQIFNPFTQTEQFYTTGVSRIADIDPGEYRLRVFRGPEYRIQSQPVTIAAGQAKQVVVTMTRWFDAAARGWYGADDHLHLTRQTREQGAQVATWLSAEGLHVGHLLQMGTLTHFAAAPQVGFGDEGTQRGSGVFLLPGQEHPRTHLFGHAITLGADAAIDERDTYMLYTPTFLAGQRGGGISGFAHWGIGPARDGLSFTATTGTVEFLEVLQFEFPHYEVWYQLLNLGIPIAATAGTDFPCLPGLPGRERFYTHVPGTHVPGTHVPGTHVPGAQIQGEFDRASLIRGIREGRTFVTNGPMIALTVAGQAIGSRIALAEPGPVRVEGELHFDVDQDDMQAFELIRNGVNVPAQVVREEGTFRLNAEVMVDRSSWFAVRAVGEKRGEVAPTSSATPAWLQSLLSQWISGGGGDEYTDYMAARRTRESLAHTSAIYVDVGPGTRKPTEEADPQAWIDQLDRIESLIASGDFESVLIWDWIPYSDGISKEHIETNAQALLDAIGRARLEFLALRDAR